MVKQRKKKFKYWNKVLACLAAMLMLIGCIPGTVQAGYYIPDEKGSFELTLQEADADGNQTPLANVGLRLYKVSSVEYDGNVHFVIDSALASTGIDFDALDGSAASVWLETAETLSKAVEKAGLTYQEQTSDAQGKVVYNNLEQGMYLIVQSDPNGKVSVAPMLLSVPFVQEGTGWTYQVQAYPKCASNTAETGINVTKRLYFIDTQNDYAIVPVSAKDATYKVGIFLDKEGTIPFRSDYMKDIHIENAETGDTSYANIPDGTYYIFELDENGNPMAMNNAIEMKDGKLFYYNVTDSSENENNTAVVNQTSTPRTVSYVNNYYYDLPDGFSLRARIKITKKVLVNGQQKTVDDTFYAGVFTQDSNGDLTLIKNVELIQNDTVEAEIPLAENEEPDKVTFVIKETDKDGNILDPDEFPYEISGEGNLEVTRKGQYKGSITLTNSKDTATPTVTKTPSETNTPTPAPGNSGNGGNQPGSHGSNSTSQHPVKTGDNTNIAIWVVLLAAAVAIIGFIGYRSRKRKK